MALSKLSDSLAECSSLSLCPGVSTLGTVFTQQIGGEGRGRRHNQTCRHGDINITITLMDQIPFPSPCPCSNLRLTNRKSGNNITSSLHYNSAKSLRKVQVMSGSFILFSCFIKITLQNRKARVVIIIRQLIGQHLGRLHCDLILLITNKKLQLIFSGGKY